MSLTTSTWNISDHPDILMHFTEHFPNNYVTEGDTQ